MVADKIDYSVWFKEISNTLVDENGVQDFVRCCHHCGSLNYKIQSEYPNCYFCDKKVW